MNLKEALLGFGPGRPRAERAAAAEKIHAVLSEASGQHVANNLGHSVVVAPHRREDVVAEVELKLLDVASQVPSRFEPLTDAQCHGYLRAMLANRELDHLRREARARAAGERASQPSPGDQEEGRESRHMESPVHTDPIEALQGLEERLQPCVEQLRDSRPPQYQDHVIQAWEEARALARGASAAEVLRQDEGAPEAARKTELDALYKRQQRFRDGLLELADSLEEEGRPDDAATLREDVAALRHSGVRPKSPERPLDDQVSGGRGGTPSGDAPSRRRPAGRSKS